MQNNPFQSEIEAILKKQQDLYKKAEESEDVKAGNCTAEEERQEPGYVLYHQISQSIVDILNQPEIANVFKSLGKEVGDDLARNLVLAIAMSMSSAAHNAIVFYDELLKGELDKQFENIAHHVNLCKADIVAHQSVLEVFRNRLDNLEKINKVNQFSKDTGVNVNK